MRPVYWTREWLFAKDLSLARHTKLKPRLAKPERLNHGPKRVRDFLSIFGGLVFFGVQLIAIQKPILPLFINELDIQMEKRYWNQLAPDAMDDALAAYARSLAQASYWDWEVEDSAVTK